MHHDLVDVLIIEDESELARLHAELVQKHPRLRLAGMAASLAQARQLLHATPPQLVLLDNYLPDGKGVTLMTDPALATSQCSVIFITAASDMETCSQAIRNGAFDYILKPVSWKRLSQSLERFIQFYDQQREWKIVDQQNVDSLYQLQAKNYRVDSGSKGIEEKRWRWCRDCLATGKRTVFPLMKWSAPPGLAKPPLVAIWSTALRPVFWKWRCCTEKLAIHGGCIAALRSKVKTPRRTGGAGNVRSRAAL